MRIKDKVTLYVMNYKGFKVLESIIDNYSPAFIHEVISSPDKNISSDYFEEIKALCNNYNISFKCRSEAKTFETHYAFSIGWRWLIPIIEGGKLIIFHDSLLPRYRGFAPLVNALLNKENKVGVTCLFASKKFDEGEIICSSILPITYPIKINSVIISITRNYIKLALKISEQIVKGSVIRSFHQDEKKASYSIWRDEDDYLIDWNQSAEDIKCFIDAVGYPYKGAKSYLENQCVRVLDAEVQKNDFKLELLHPGKILFTKNHYPVVICGSGLLLITELVSDNDKKSLFPLDKFRLRFKSR